MKEGLAGKKRSPRKFFFLQVELDSWPGALDSSQESYYSTIQDECIAMSKDGAGIGIMTVGGLIGRREKYGFDTHI